jgi:uncharacterized protein
MPSAQDPSSRDDDLAIQRLQSLLDALPEPLEPMDVSALDGYLAGVLVQPVRPPDAEWLPLITDLQGRAPPPGAATDELHALVRRRYAAVDRAIERRDWFDPWVFDGEEASAGDAVLPWAAGFATAMDRFPALMDAGDPALIEPLALIYLHFDPADLEDADALLEVIETIEPPAGLADAVQDLVRALMLMADVTRPRRPVAQARPAPRPAPRRTRRR